MDSIRTEALHALNANLHTVREETRKSKQPTTATIVTFNTDVRIRSSQIAIGSLQNLQPSFYRPEGGTALFDAVGETTQLLAGRADAAERNVSFCAIVITDGEENSSRRFFVPTQQEVRHYSNPQDQTRMVNLKDLIREQQLTDRWTFAFMLPDEAYRQRFLANFDVPPGNVAVWETSSAGMKAAEVNVSAGIRSYIIGRDQGQTSSKSFFTTDLSSVSVNDLQGLTDLSPLVREASVAQDADVQTFCRRRFGGFVKGGVYYLLKKAETIQAYKKILIMEKGGSRIFGGSEARQLLKLPSTSVRVHPGNHAGYEVFVQSTSTNRMLRAGTRVLYAPTV